MKNIIVILGVIASIVVGIIIAPRLNKQDSGQGTSTTIFIPPQGGVLGNGNKPRSVGQSTGVAVIISQNATPPPASPAPSAQPISKPVQQNYTPAQAYTAKPTNAPATHIIYPQTVSSGTTTETFYQDSTVYRMDVLNFQITTPSSWIPSANTATEDDILFYNSDNNFLEGTIRVLVNANQSFESLSLQMQADPSVSGLRQTQIGGISALVFNSGKFGGTTYATVYHNNVYYFVGHLTNPSILGTVGFFN